MCCCKRKFGDVFLTREAIEKNFVYMKFCKLIKFCNAEEIFMKMY